MFTHANRRHFTILALVAGLNAAACSKKEADVQPAAASGPTPSQPSASPVSPGASTNEGTMDPAMKNHDHSMEPGMEKHGQKHDGGHP